MAEKQLDPERLKSATSQLIDAITSTEYIAQIREVRSAPEEQRRLEATRRMSVSALREAGVDLPSDFRVSNRYFEQNFEIRDEDPYPPPEPGTPATESKPAGWSVCAGAGGDKYCGCAGFSGDEDILPPDGSEPPVDGGDGGVVTDPA